MYIAHLPNKRDDLQRFLWRSRHQLHRLDNHHTRRRLTHVDLVADVISRLLGHADVTSQRRSLARRTGSSQQEA